MPGDSRMVKSSKSLPLLIRLRAVTVRVAVRRAAVSTSTPKPIRSPAYPAVPLRDAISNVKKIEAAYRRSSVDREAAAKLIGYSGLSGPANKTLAALAQYGLVERAGKGEMRVTALAQAVLHPDNEAEKRRALREAAFGSGLFQELQERWPNMVPPEDGVVTYLYRQGFNQSAIKPAARAYLQTLSLLEEAGAGESHGLEQRPGADSTPPDEGRGGDHPERTFCGAAVGDLVQWESQGVLKLETPKRVRLVSEDGQWIAVEGSEAGIPMEQVIVEERAPPAAVAAPRFALDREPELKAASGEAEWMRNSLGAATKVRLLVTGGMGPREIGKLIKLLEAQRAVLDDEDDLVG